jgi:hypothetical protein
MITKCDICRQKKSCGFWQSYTYVCDECMDKLIRRAAEKMKQKQARDEYEDSEIRQEVAEMQAEIGEKD